MSQHAFALQVGNLELGSLLGQPLNASVKLTNVSDQEFSSIKATLASRQQYQKSEVTYPENAGEIRLDVKRVKNAALVSIQSDNAISDPYMHLLVNFVWTGGSILREYPILLDPPLGNSSNDDLALPVDTSKFNYNKTSAYQVKAGDTLSEIADRHLPPGVYAEQAWMAIYKINSGAFIDGNLNNLTNNITLNIPTREQMLAVPRSDAFSQVVTRLKPIPGAAPISTSQPTLLIGGRSGTQSSIDNASTSNKQVATTPGFAQLASIQTDFVQFRQEIKNELQANREQTNLIKDEIIATRGENQVIADRVSQIEEQLININKMLALQLESAKIANQAHVDSTMLDAHDDSTMLDAHDDSAVHLEEKNQGSATKFTAETTHDNETTQVSPASKFNDLQAELAATIDGIIQDSNVELEKGALDDGHDLASLDLQLSPDLQAELTQSQQKIKSLQALLQAKTQAVDGLPVTGAAGASTPMNVDNIDNGDGNSSFSDHKNGIVSKIIDGFNNLLAILNKNKIIALAAIFALLGLQLFWFMKRRNTEPQVNEEFVSDQQELNSEASYDADNMEESDIHDDMTQHHGSSLFDISDESLLASEAVNADSSLFAIIDSDINEDDSTSVETGSALVLMPKAEETDDNETSASATQNKIDSSVVDAIAEADVYLAYDRKSRAINLLKSVIEKDSNQPEIVAKLLGLYATLDDKKSFTQLFDDSIEHFSGSTKWNNAIDLAEKTLPDHSYFVSKVEENANAELPVIEDIAESQLINSSEQTNNIDEEPLASEEFAATEKHSTGLQLEEDSDDVVVGRKVDTSADISPETPKPEPTVAAEEENLNSDKRQEPDLDEGNKYDPETSLGLAKAYIELGEDKIAIDFLTDVVKDGDSAYLEEAKELLKSLS